MDHPNRRDSLAVTNHRHSRSCGCDLTTLVYELLEWTEEIMAAQDKLNDLVVAINDTITALEGEIQVIKDGNATLDFSGVDKILARLHTDVVNDAPPVATPPVVTPPVTTVPPVDVTPVTPPVDVPPSTPEVPVGA